MGELGEGFHPDTTHLKRAVPVFQDYHHRFPVLALAVAGAAAEAVAEEPGILLMEVMDEAASVGLAVKVVKEAVLLLSMLLRY